MNNISIIIPTYKRAPLLNEVLKALIMQDGILEIIIVDSNSNDGTKDIVKKYNQNSEISIKYLDVENNVALKRNIGIKESRAGYLIFLDDDCVPNENFVSNHLSSLSKNPNCLFCGDVFFPKELVDSSNYIRFKNSRHIRYRYGDSIDLDFKSIVTMNMSIKKENIIKNNLFFREDFIGYGMEDNEFGCQVMESEIKIKKCPASIQHMESNNPFLFSTKIFHTARDGVYKLKTINKKAVMRLPYSYFFERDYIHKNILVRYLIKPMRLLFNIKIAKYVLKLLDLIDIHKLLYFPLLYSYVYASYYNEGVKKRKEAYKSINEISNSWYSDND